MFTGIITATVPVIANTKRNDSLFLTIKKPAGWRLKPGDSVAVNGVCLTVRRAAATSWTAELMPETLAITSFGEYIPEAVNLERPLALGDRLDGHLVLGHIDTVGVVTKIVPHQRSTILTVFFPERFARLVAIKGSIALDGVSLTVVKAGKNWCNVALVDFTLTHTIFGQRKKGDRINIEFDIVGKYIGNFVKKK